MIYTFGQPFRDHARDKWQGLNPNKWEMPGRTASEDGLVTDVGSNESVNQEAAPATAAQDPTTEAGEVRHGEMSTEQSEKV
jgi:hypothetical protein